MANSAHDLLHTSKEVSPSGRFLGTVHNPTYNTNSKRSDVCGMQGKFTVPIEVRVVLVGLASDGAYSYQTDAKALQAELKEALSTHCPAIMEVGQQADVCYNVNFVVVEAVQVRLRSSWRRPQETCS